MGSSTKVPFNVLLLCSTAAEICTVLKAPLVVTLARVGWAHRKNSDSGHLNTALGKKSQKPSIFFSTLFLLLGNEGPIGDVGDQGMLGKIGPIGGKGKLWPVNFGFFPSR